MSTRGATFHILPNHCKQANRPDIGPGGGIISSRRYQYNNSPIAVNKCATSQGGKNICDTILIAARSGATPLDTNPYMMTL